jgi:hypothetical protein
MGGWVAFSTAVKEAFADQETDSKARYQLDHMDQGARTIDEYLTWFEFTCGRAGLTDEKEKINILVEHVSPVVMRTVHNSDMVPTKFLDFKKRVQNVGRNQERYELKRRRQAPRPSPPAPSRFHPTPAPSRSYSAPQHPPPQPHYVRTGTGKTYTGTGKAMEVDALKKTSVCFNCGKAGHFRNKCKEPRKKTLNVRGVSLQLSLEEKAQLMDLLSQELASDAPSLPVVKEDDDEEEINPLENVEETDFL